MEMPFGDAEVADYRSNGSFHIELDTVLPAM